MENEIIPSVKKLPKKTIIIIVVVVVIIVGAYVGYMQYKKIHANDALKQEYQQKVAILQSLNDYYAAHPVADAQKAADMKAFLKISAEKSAAATSKAKTTTVKVTTKK